MLTRAEHPEAKLFWDHVDAIKREVDGWPEWKRNYGFTRYSKKARKMCERKLQKAYDTGNTIKLDVEADEFINGILSVKTESETVFEIRKVNGDIVCIGDMQRGAEMVTENLILDMPAPLFLLECYDQLQEFELITDPKSEAVERFVALVNEKLKAKGDR